jgi:hypothetical protein
MSFTPSVRQTLPLRQVDEQDVVLGGGKGSDAPDDQR